MTCSACLSEKEAPDFPLRGRMCNACKVVRARAAKARWRATHPEQDKAMVRRWRGMNIEHIREYQRSWAATNAGLQRAASARWHAANAERVRMMHTAHQRVYRDIRAGKLVRPSTCEGCSITGVAIEAAHHDYSRPLDIRWLCRPCHRRWDAAEPKTKARSA